MLDYEVVFRVFAALAAVVVVASPALVASWKAVQGWIISQKAIPPSERGSGIEEMRVVLELANKLKARGNQQGVELCKQLLDALLQTPSK